MLSTKSNVDMFELQHTTNVKLVGNEWVRTPGPGKLVVAKGQNFFVQVRNNVINMNPNARSRYDRLLIGVDRPQAPVVNIYAKWYGKQQSNNRVPNTPKVKLWTGAVQPKTLRPRKHTHRQFVDAKSNNPVHSDPRCLRGLRNNLVCCPSWCNTCVPANCGGNTPACCPDSIRLDASSCDTFAPPCYLSRKFTAEGRLYGPPSD